MGSDSPAESTSATLLNRLRTSPLDQGAWNDFVECYGRRIYGWCRRWGLQEADAEDVTQDVLLRLAAKLRDFAYDRSRSFRGWLRTLTHHALSDFLQDELRPGQSVGNGPAEQALAQAEARDDLTRRLDEEFTHALLEEASARVRLRVQRHTWEAFRLTALEGKSGAEAAALLGMRVATVFVARSKVQKMLQDEVHGLEAADGAEKR
jgi:RNA polymerase sigma-70 factor (ECF subfamily)